MGKRKEQSTIALVAYIIDSSFQHTFLVHARSRDIDGIGSQRGSVGDDVHLSRKFLSSIVFSDRSVADDLSFSPVSNEPSCLYSPSSNSLISLPDLFLLLPQLFSFSLSQFLSPYTRRRRF